MTSDELRSEYRREDFGPMVRGKYAARLKESSNIIVLDPEIAEAFPNPDKPEPTRHMPSEDSCLSCKDLTG